MTEREKFEKWWSDQPGSIRDDENFRWKAEYGFKAAERQIGYENDDLLKERDALKSELRDIATKMKEIDLGAALEQAMTILKKYPESK